MDRENRNRKSWYSVLGSFLARRWAGLLLFLACAGIFALVFSLYDLELKRFCMQEACACCFFWLSWRQTFAAALRAAAGMRKSFETCLFSRRSCRQRGRWRRQICRRY